LRGSDLLVRALCRTLQARTREPVELLETHISWVLLAGEHAYKLKKPVRLPFVDYGSVEARHRFCEEELRLNRRLAPSLYLGVSRITGSPQEPELDGDGPVIDHAVRMRRFPPGALFAERLAAGTLGAPEIDALAALLAQFHHGAPRADAVSGFGSAPARRAAALATVGALAASVPRPEHAELRAWLERNATELAPLWSQRQAAGRVRECHGDLHLHNVLLLDGDVAAFDGIEFDPALRWIDVIDDIAFPAMDLLAHGRRDLAWRFVNAWLDRSGDHAGLPVLRFSMVYRALVRAQVAALRGGGAMLRMYVDTALALARESEARLLITHGLPGSGKTVASQQLLEHVGAVRLRSDVERKRLAGLAALDDSNARGVALYGEVATERTYAHLLATARVALLASYPTIIDAAFLRRSERAAARELARELKLPFAILDCRADLALLRERVSARQGRRDDASEAGIDVLERLHGAHEALGDDERAQAIVLDAAHAPDVASIAATWLAR